MDNNEKYQMIDRQSVLDTILPVFRPSVKVAVMQRSNGVYILISNHDIDTDQVIAISLALYGVHNALQVSSFTIYEEIRGYHICLFGSVYRILPKYYAGNATVGKKAVVSKYEPEESQN